jgi:Ca-activated chloride channel family protein
MKVDARLTFEKIRHDKDLDAHLVLTLTAPPIEAQQKRPALCIIPVVDVSPSMYEEDGRKIAYAKRSVEKLIEHLGPDDYCGLAQFSGTAEIIQRPVKVTAERKHELRRKVNELRCGSGTNIADALLVGLDLGNKMDLPGSVITRVVLFTDGGANMGPARDLAGLVKILEANIGTCTASAFGYGADADQNLLGELAKKGSGNYAFVQNPDDALTAFGKELGGLLSTYATSIVLNVTACADHEITDVVSDVDSEEEKIGQGVRIKIPNILAEETRNIVLGVKVKAQKAVGPRAVNVFEVKAGWDILNVNSKKEREGAEAKAKAQFVKEDDAQAKPEADLDKIVSLAEVIRAQLEAEEAAKRGEFAKARQRMKAAATHAASRGHNHAQYLAEQVECRVSSALAYNDGGGYLRSLSTGGTRGFGTASYDASASADLMAAGAVLSNSLQTSTSNAFAGGAVGAGIAAPAPSFSIAQGVVAPVATAAPWVTNQGLPEHGAIWGGTVAPALGGVASQHLVVPAPDPVQAASPPLPRTNSKDAKKKSSLSKKQKSRW